jgi:hypothetical protein
MSAAAIRSPQSPQPGPATVIIIRSMAFAGPRGRSHLPAKLTKPMHVSC